MHGTPQWYTSARVRSRQPASVSKEEVPGTPVLDMCGVLAVQAVRSQCLSTAVGQPFDKVGVTGERHLDAPCRSPNYWDSVVESICGLEGGIWSRHGQYADGNLAFHPATSERLPARTLIIMSASEWQQNQTVYALIDEGSLLDPAVQVLGTGTPTSSWRDKLLFQVVLWRSQWRR